MAAYRRAALWLVFFLFGAAAACDVESSNPSAETTVLGSGAAPPFDPQSVLSVTVTACVSHGTAQQAKASVISDNLALTVAHPFTEFRRFTVRDRDGVPVPADLIIYHPDRDVAVLRLGTPWASGVALAPSEPEPIGDQPVWLPSDQGSLIAGTASPPALVTIDGHHPRVAAEVSLPIQLGQSGSPVIDSDGAIVGIVFAADRDPTQNRGWITAISEYQAIIAQFDTDLGTSRADAPPVTNPC